MSRDIRITLYNKTQDACTIVAYPQVEDLSPMAPLVWQVIPLKVAEEEYAEFYYQSELVLRVSTSTNPHAPAESHAVIHKPHVMLWGEAWTHREASPIYVKQDGPNSDGSMSCLNETDARQTFYLLNDASPLLMCKSVASREKAIFTPCPIVLGYTTAEIIQGSVLNLDVIQPTRCPLDFTNATSLTVSLVQDESGKKTWDVSQE